MPSDNSAIIYISAAADLMPERETLARMIAALPVSLPWRILQTPIHEEYLDLAMLQRADVHFLLIGGDIRAPVGLEWRTANISHRNSIAFLKRGLNRTPAGQLFVRETNITWQMFDNAADLSHQVQHHLIKHLLRHSGQYTITPVEIEQLNILLTTDTSTKPSMTGQEAGHSAVIMSRERYEPTGSTLIDET